MTVTLNTVDLFNGQGFDVQSMVNQVLDAERGQENQWKSQQTTLQSQATALNQLETQVASLYTDANNLRDFTGVFGSVTASSSDPGILYATANSSAAIASHVLQVKSLASTGAAYSAALKSGDTLDPGTISLTVGATTQNVNVSASESLADVASAINNLGMGVTARVQTDSAGSRLAIVSNASGANGLVSVTGTDQLGFTTTAGQDAVVNVDGIPYQSSTNLVSGAVSGVTLNLASASPDTDVTLTVSPDASSVASALNTFVTDYNAVISAVNAQFTYSASTNSAGILSGDSAVREVQQSLLSLTAFSMPGNGAITSLRSLGVEMQDDGTLSINSSNLNSALAANFSDLANFFQGSNSFGTVLGTTLTALNSPVNGPLALDLQSVQATSQDLTNQINEFEARLTAQQQVLTDQYSQINAELQQLPMLQSQLSSELGSLDPFTSNSSSKSSS